MIEDKLITNFIPAKALESPINTTPESSLEDKIKKAMRRFLTNESFTEGEIVESTPRLIIVSYYFDPKRMGYDVIARIL